MLFHASGAAERCCGASYSVLFDYLPPLPPAYYTFFIPSTFSALWIRVIEFTLMHVTTKKENDEDDADNLYIQNELRSHFQSVIQQTWKKKNSFKKLFLYDQI